MGLLGKGLFPPHSRRNGGDGKDGFVAVSNHKLSNSFSLRHRTIRHVIGEGLDVGNLCDVDEEGGTGTLGEAKGFSTVLDGKIKCPELFGLGSGALEVIVPILEGGCEVRRRHQRVDR